MEKKRYLELDIARAICALYIVAFWHLNQYLVVDYKLSGGLLNFCHNLTLAVLGTFTFISGLLLNRYNFRTGTDVKTFFGKRIKRFFLLLLISAVSYLVLSWVTIGQFIQIISGTNLVIGPSAPTLWFFSMMILFYIITPIVGCINRFSIRILVTIAVYCIFILLCVYKESDMRLLFYYPVYMLGLYLGTDKLYSLFNKKYILYLTLPMIAVFWLPYSSVACNFLSVLLGVGFLMALSFLIGSANGGKQTKASFLTSFTSTASMVAYLFHRQFFSPLQHLSFSLGFSGIPLLMALFAVIALFVISYYTQLYYDKLFKR